MGAAARVRTDDEQEWIAPAIGAWLVASPWALGFGHKASAAWSHLAAEAGAVLASAIALWRLQSSTRTSSL